MVHEGCLKSRVEYLLSEATTEDWAKKHINPTEGASTDTPIILVDPIDPDFPVDPMLLDD